MPTSLTGAASAAIAEEQDDMKSISTAGRLGLATAALVGVLALTQPVPAFARGGGGFHGGGFHGGGFHGGGFHGGFHGGGFHGGGFHHGFRGGYGGGYYGGGYYPGCWYGFYPYCY
jgi:hypothetical protein